MQLLDITKTFPEAYSVRSLLWTFFKGLAKDLSGLLLWLRTASNMNAFLDIRQLKCTNFLPFEPHIHNTDDLLWQIAHEGIEWTTGDAAPKRRIASTANPFDDANVTFFELGTDQAQARPWIHWDLDSFLFLKL